MKIVKFELIKDTELIEISYKVLFGRIKKRKVFQTECTKSWYWLDGGWYARINDEINAFVKTGKDFLNV